MKKVKSYKIFNKIDDFIEVSETPTGNAIEIRTYKNGSTSPKISLSADEWKELCELRYSLECESAVDLAESTKVE